LWQGLSGTPQKFFPNNPHGYPLPQPTCINIYLNKRINARNVTIFLGFFWFLLWFLSNKKGALSEHPSIFIARELIKPGSALRVIQIYSSTLSSYVSAPICMADCAYSSLFSLLSRASWAGSLKGSSIRFKREEFMQMIVTSKAENKIQAVTIEIIMTVMAYSLHQFSSSKPIIPKCDFFIVPNCPTRKLSA